MGGGKGGGGGGVDTEALLQNTERNIDFQTDLFNQVSGLSAPFQEVGFNALNQLAAFSGLEPSSRQPNFFGELGDPRFLDTGTVDQRIANLGAAPSRTISQTRNIPAVVEEGRGRGQGGFSNVISPARTSTSQVANPAYQAYLDNVARIRGQGDVEGPQSGADLREQGIQAFFDSPEFRLTHQASVDEATKAQNRAASARGQLNSQPNFNAIGDNAGRLANQTFGQFKGGLSQLAGFGATGLGTTANSASNTGAQVGSALTNLNSSLLNNQQLENQSQNSSGFNIGGVLGAAAAFL